MTHRRSRATVLATAIAIPLAHSSGEAAGLGLGRFFDAHESKTGTFAAIDASTLEPVAAFEGETDSAEYQAVLTEEPGACGT